MKHSSKTKTVFKFLSLAVLSILIILLGLTYWLYSGELTQTKINVLNSFPFPMAIVNGEVLPMSQLTLRYEIATKTLDSSKNESAAEVKNLVYANLIKEAEVRVVAKKVGIDVGQKEIEAEYAVRQEANLAQDNTDFKQMLLSYGLTEKTFKTEVIKPYLINYKLKVWYNSQKNLNQSNYQLAQDILNKQQNGQTFSELATTFTQDEMGKKTQGDLGFVDIAEILPELRELVSSMKVGDTSIFPSSLGIHIINVEEKNGNKLHLRQIFIGSTGFNSWFSSQIQNIKINKLLKI